MRVLLCWIFFGMRILSQEIEITDEAQGRTIRVAPEEVTETEILFSLKGQEFRVPLKSLTSESLSEVKKWQEGEGERRKAKIEALNALVGQPLFSHKSLWAEKSHDVAKRLKWPEESTTAASSSFRLYPPSSYGFLNARPYCATLFGGDEGMTTNLSIVYANKGDYGSKRGRGENHFESQGDLPPANSLNAAIKRDQLAISLALTEAFGEPQEQRYGEKEDRRDVLRWDYKSHSFILSALEGEYVHLAVVPLEVANNQGRIERVSDMQLRAELEKNVVRSDNGDVVLKNIPMVDQGPKGYCVPATFERAMRYMRVPADMYLLATIATDRKRGSNPVKLAEYAKRIIRSKGRRIRELDLVEDLNQRLVARYIEKGVPIMWSMASSKKYNKIADVMTEKRAKNENWPKWSSLVRKLVQKEASSMQDDVNYHICMIIGYNEQTQEFAVSDSWGPRYELRWIPMEIATRITVGSGFLIDL